MQFQQLGAANVVYLATKVRLAPEELDDILKTVKHIVNGRTDFTKCFFPW